MNYRIKLTVLLTAITLCFISCSYRFLKDKSKGFLFLAVFFGWELLTEAAAAYCAIQYRNNYLVYSIMLPFGVLWASFYFNYSNPLLRKHHIAAKPGILFLAVQSSCLLAGLPPETLYSNAELFECTLMVGFGLAQLFAHGVMTQRSPFSKHLYTGAFFLVFYLGSFIIRACVFFQDTGPSDRQTILKLFHFLYWGGILFYTGTAVLLLWPAKPLKSYEDAA